MGKHDQESAAVGARRATGAATGGGGRGGRFSAGRKRETVLRLLRGEDLDSVSRELGITDYERQRCHTEIIGRGTIRLAVFTRAIGVAHVAAWGRRRRSGDSLEEVAPGIRNDHVRSASAI